MDKTLRRSVPVVVAALLIALACLMAAPAISQVTGWGANDTQAFAASKAKLSKKSCTLVYGKKKTITVKNAAGKKAKWKSSNSKVAKIVKKTKTKVVVKGMSAGTATIKAKVGGKTLKCKVRVKGKLSRKSATINSLQTVTLQLKGAKAKSWKLASSDNYLSIKKNGNTCVVSAGSLGAAGEDKVICYDTKGNKYTCSVTLEMPPVYCRLVRTESETLIGTSKMYYKRYQIYNGTGKTMKLTSDSAVLYYPWGIGDNVYATLPVQSPRGTYLSTAPLIIPAKGTGDLWGVEGVSDTGIYSGGESAFVFYLGGKKYLGAFGNSGYLRIFLPE